MALSPVIGFDDAVVAAVTTDKDDLLDVVAFPPGVVPPSIFTFSPDDGPANIALLLLSPPMDDDDEVFECDPIVMELISDVI